MELRNTLLGIALLVRATNTTAQAPAMAWEAFFNGTLPGVDEAHALIIAPDNSIYVTGGSTNIAPQGTITTIRYAPDGTQLWADHPYGPSQDTQNRGVDMALDPWGHVFVCGNFSANAGDLCVVKYNSGGRLWRRNFEQYPTADVPDEATGIAVDAAGEVYVSGFITSTSGMGLDNYTLKVDSAGNELWNDDFALSSADEVARDVAVSPSGNIFVGGDWWNLGGSGGIDVSTVRFAPDGTRLWDEGHDAAGFSDRLARISATDNGVIACGTATVASTPDAVIVARDANGAELWSLTYAGSGNVDDDAVDLRELSDGRVAAAIHSREMIGGGLRHTITTLLIDSGTVVWSQQFTGDAGLGAWPTAMAIDANDNIHIAGYAITTGGATTDGLVLKYDATGALQWSIAYDGGSNGDDRFNAIALNAYGDVVACGSSHTSATESRYVTVQFGNAVGIDGTGAIENEPAVFPNPVSDRLMLRGLAIRGIVEVYDAIGNCLVATQARTIDVSAWSEGIYFVKVGERTQRMVIQH